MTRGTERGRPTTKAKVPGRPASGPAERAGRPTVAVATPAAIVLFLTLVVPQGWGTSAGLRYLAMALVLTFGLPIAVAMASGGARAEEGDATGAPRVGLRLTLGCGAAFCAWALLASAASGHAAFSVLGNLDWSAGAGFVVVLVAAYAVGAGSGHEARRLLERALVAAVLVNAGVAVAQQLVDLSALQLGTFDTRSPGLFYNPVVLASFLVGGLWLLIRRFPENQVKFGIGIAVVGAAIQVSGSRYGLFLAVVAGGAALIVIGARRGATVLVLIALGLGVGALVSGVGGGASGTSRLVATEATGSGLTPRLDTWIAAAHSVAEHPILGTGPGRFVAASAPRRTLGLVRSEGVDRLFLDAHNIVVEYAATSGVPGALLLVAFVGLAFARSGWRAPLAGFAVFGLLMHLVEPQSPALTPACFLALGSAGAPLRPIPAVGPRVVRAGVASLLTAAAVVVMVGCWSLHRAAPYRPADVRRARQLLSIWPDPYYETAVIDQAVATAHRDRTGLEDALRWWRRAAAKDPENPQLWTGAGVVDVDLRDLPAAQSAFMRALRADPWTLTALEGLGYVADSEHRVDEARHWYRLVLEVSPGQPQATARLAQLGAGG